MTTKYCVTFRRIAVVLTLIISVGVLSACRGPAGENGIDGMDGSNGKSAYELAVENGYDGTLTEWLETLAGKNGVDGKSAYEVAVENGYSGTVEEWLASLVGKDGSAVEKGDKGEDGKDGQTPFIGENGHWWIGDTDTGVKAAGTTGAQGEKGETGEKGDKGDTGARGEAGTSVVSAYVDENLHLWIELSNNTKIDAGYVGVAVTPGPDTTPAIYTVEFKDWDGTILKTQQVASGAAAIPPAEPTRQGYTFAGWDKSFDYITGDLVITATYIADIGARNTLAVSYTENGDNTVTVLVAIQGNTVQLAGLDGYISYDNSVLSYCTSEKLSSLSGSVNHIVNESRIYFALAGATDITSSESLFSITFAYNGKINTQLDLTVTDIYNQEFETETYVITGGAVSID